jgi:hypothetical protein
MQKTVWIFIGFVTTQADVPSKKYPGLSLILASGTEEHLISLAGYIRVFTPSQSPATPAL